MRFRNAFLPTIICSYTFGQSYGPPKILEFWLVSYSLSFNSTVTGYAPFESSHSGLSNMGSHIDISDQMRTVLTKKHFFVTFKKSNFHIEVFIAPQPFYGERNKTFWGFIWRLVYDLRKSDCRRLRNRTSKKHQFTRIQYAFFLTLNWAGGKFEAAVARAMSLPIVT